MMKSVAPRLMGALALALLVGALATPAKAAPVTLTWVQDTPNNAQALITGNLQELFPTNPTGGNQTVNVPGSGSSPGNFWALTVQITATPAGIYSITSVVGKKLPGDPDLVMPGTYNDLANTKPNPLIRQVVVPGNAGGYDVMTTSLLDPVGPAGPGVTFSPGQTFTLVVTLAAVPEPSQYAMAALGLMTFGGAAWARRRRSA